MPFIKKIICLCLLLCFLHEIQGQTGVDQVQIKIYEFEEGLSHRDVYQIKQDAHGFLWIATANGLNRFDSKHFLYLNRDTLLAAHNISELQFNSGSDKLWLSQSNRIVQLDLNNSKTKEIFPANKIVPAQSQSPLPHSSSGISYNNLLIDKENNLWTCSYDNQSGLTSLQQTNETGELEKILSAKGSFEKRALAQWNDRIVFSYDENTLLEVDQEGEIFHRYKLAAPNDASAKSWITQIQNSGDSILWALSNNGQIYFLEKGMTAFKKHNFSQKIENQTSYQAFNVLKNGDIWVAGRNALWWYQAATKRAFDFTKNIRDYVKHGVNFRQVFEDQTGVIWVASDFGLIKLTFPNPLFINYLAEGNELCSEGACSIRAMTEDEAGNIYISYYNSIHRLDPKRNIITPVLSNSRFNSPPFGLLYHQNKLWTGNGLSIDLKKQTVDTLFSMPIIDLGVVILDHEKELWFGYRNRIFTYNTQKKKLTEKKELAASLDSTTLDISFLYQSPSDLTIWIGTLNSGLFRIDKYKGLLEHYDTKGSNGLSLLHNKINGIYEDKNQQLWLATGKGLHQMDLKNQQLSVYLPENGLAHSFINGLLSEGDSVIWASTDNGLSRFSMATKKAISFKEEDGITANEFNRVSFYKAKDKRMYFGGLLGINAFYPGNHFLRQRETREGKILLTQFSKLDGNKDSLINFDSGLQDGDPIGISWKDKLFTFKFALANFDNPGSHQFSYKLEGLEKEWSAPTSLNSARYNSIPHGNYTFRVRARNGDNNWNNTELAIPIQIEQAFYTTWWFLALSGVLLAGLILLFSQYRLHQSRKREMQLKREVRARTLDLEREVKKSDELLLNILPAHIAEELKSMGKAKARRHETVTVFFSDFKGFTRITQQLTPEELVTEIDHCFREFDKIMDKYNLEKIKTIGDAYMCAGGITNELENSALNVVKAALDIQDFMKELAIQKSAKNELFFEARIGIHSGPVVSGIVGIKKFAFDIWGDTVNIAARLENSGEVGKVNVSESTYELIKEEYNCLHRGKISVKNLEDVDMYFVTGKR